MADETTSDTTASTPADSATGSSSAIETPTGPTGKVATDRSLLRTLLSDLQQTFGTSEASGVSGTSGQQGFCGTEERVSDPSCGSLHPAVAFGSAGNAGITWHDIRDGNFEIYFRVLDSNIGAVQEGEASSLTFDPDTGRQANLNCSGFSNTQALDVTKICEEKENSDKAKILVTQSGGRMDVNATSRTLVLTATKGSKDFQKLNVTPNSTVKVLNGSNAGKSFLVTKVVAPDVLELAFTPEAQGDTGFVYSIIASDSAAKTCDVKLTCNKSSSIFPDIVADSEGRYHIVYQDNESGHYELYYIQIYPKSVGLKKADSTSLPVGSKGFGTIPDSADDRAKVTVTTAGKTTSASSFVPTGEKGAFFAYGNRLLPNPIPRHDGPFEDQRGLHRIFRDIEAQPGPWVGVSEAADRDLWEDQSAALGMGVQPDYVALSGNPVAGEGDFGTRFAFKDVAFVVQSPPDRAVGVTMVALPLKPKCAPNAAANELPPRTQDLVSAPKKPVPPSFTDPVDLSNILNSPLARIDETVPPRFTVEGDDSGTVFTNILTDDGRGELTRLVFNCDSSVGCKVDEGVKFILGQRTCGKELCAMKPGAGGPEIAPLPKQYRINLQVWVGPDYRTDPGQIISATMSAEMLIEREFDFDPGEDISTFAFQNGELKFPDGRYIFLVAQAKEETDFYVLGVGGGHTLWSTNGDGRFDQFYSPFTVPPASDQATGDGVAAPVYYEGYLEGGAAKVDKTKDKSTEAAIASDPDCTLTYNLGTNQAAAKNQQGLTNAGSITVVPPTQLGNPFQNAAYAITSFNQDAQTAATMAGIPAGVVLNGPPDHVIGPAPLLAIRLDVKKNSTLSKVVLEMNTADGVTVTGPVPVTTTGVTGASITVDVVGERTDATGISRPDYSKLLGNASVPVDELPDAAFDESFSWSQVEFSFPDLALPAGRYYLVVRSNIEAGYSSSSGFFAIIWTNGLDRIVDTVTIGSEYKIQVHALVHSIGVIGFLGGPDTETAQVVVNNGSKKETKYTIKSVQDLSHLTLDTTAGLTEGLDITINYTNPNSPATMEVELSTIPPVGVPAAGPDGKPLPPDADGKRKYVIPIENGNTVDAKIARISGTTIELSEAIARDSIEGKINNRTNVPFPSKESQLPGGYFTALSDITTSTETVRSFFLQSTGKMKITTVPLEPSIVTDDAGWTPHGSGPVGYACLDVPEDDPAETDSDVTEETGTLSGPTEIADFQVAAPIKLTESNGDSVHPRMAVDKNDNIWLAFHSNRTGTDEVYIAKYFGAAGQWGTTTSGGTETRISNAGLNAKNARFPNVAVDAVGEAHIVYHSDDTDDERNEIFYVKTTGKGNQVMKPKRLTSSSGDAMMPDIAIASNAALAAGTSDCTKLQGNSSSTAGSGRIIVVWHDNRFDNFEIISAYKLGGRWISSGQGSQDMRLTLAPGDSLFPRIATDGMGNARVAYHDFRRGLENPWIYMSTYAGFADRWVSSAQGGTDLPITPTGTKQSLHPDIALDATNGVEVVWHDTRFAGGTPEQHEAIMGTYCPRLDSSIVCFAPICSNIEKFIDTKFDIVDCVNQVPIDATNVPEVCLRITSPGATFFRAANENGAYSKWENFKPSVTLDTMVVPWTLSCGNGKKSVCVQIQDANSVGFPICKDVVLQSPLPAFKIDFFKDDGLTIPLPIFGSTPVAPEGDVYVRLTSSSPLVSSPTFDVVSRGTRLIFNQATLPVNATSGASGFSGTGSFAGNVVSGTDNLPGAEFSAFAGNVFKGRFRVKRDDGFFYVDGLARLIPHGKDFRGRSF